MLSKLSASINGIYLVHNEVSDVLFNLNPGTSEKAGKSHLSLLAGGALAQGKVGSGGVIWSVTFFDRDLLQLCFPSQNIHILILN